MSQCAGKTICEIYRDKKYCRKENARSNDEICNCRHAVMLCEVSRCVFENTCRYKKSPAE